MSKARTVSDRRSGREMPDSVAQNIHLRETVWPRMHKENKNWVCVIVGETGSGKSLAAIRLGEVLDPNFNLKNVHFDAEGVLARAEETKPPGTIDVLDEAGVAVGNRTWWEESNQAINELLQTWREQNRGLILTVPDWNKIDKAIRDRIHHQITMRSVDHSREISRAEFQLIKTDHAGEYDNGGIVKHHPKYRDGNRERYFREIKFRLPSEKIHSRYEQAKSEVLRILNRENREKLSDDDSSSSESESRDAHDIADEILAGDPDTYIKDNNGQQYIDRDEIELDFGIGARKSKKVKKLMQREGDINAM